MEFASIFLRTSFLSDWENVLWIRFVLCLTVYRQSERKNGKKCVGKRLTMIERVFK